MEQCRAVSKSSAEPFSLVSNARLHGRDGFFHLTIRDGLLEKIEASSEPIDPAEGFDAKGGLVTPPFVDPHFHLDSVYSLEETGQNRSGTLLEGIALWKAYKESLTPEQIINRARRYCEEAIRFGLQAIRSHVDVSYESGAGVKGLLALQKEFAGRLDIQLVAFPQDGLFRNPNGEAWLLEALDAGVDLIGGIPHFERTYEEGARSVDWICRTAAERGIRVDLHCDETDDGASHHIETLAAKTVEYGLVGKTAASHTTSLHSAEDAWFAKLLPLLVEAGITVIPNPLINLTLQGRFDGYPKRRGITRIPELDQAGVPVALGQDCVRDPWYPLGTGNLLDVAHFTVHASQMTGTEEMDRLLPMITTHGADAMGLEGYALKENEPAHLLVFEAETFSEILRYRSKPKLILRGGKAVG
ncbi:MAG: cytosine deaminase [Verrucomicrobiota bacterium]